MGAINDPMIGRPYPGLRPFRRDEADIFFGREEQVDQLLAKLDRRRFVAVVGTSGCGKSSLVAAGLIAGLETGLFGRGRIRWRVASMRPGGRPMVKLAEALVEGDALGPILPVPSLLAALKSGPLGLTEILSRSRPDGSPVLGDGENLLLIIDQFEEIFRYRKAAEPTKDRAVGRDLSGQSLTMRSSTRRAESDQSLISRPSTRRSEEVRNQVDAFVALILASVARASREGGPPLYVVLTMRSDFLGDCALFPGLPEELNDSQFLAPRLDREQRRASIEGPSKVWGGRVEPSLVNRLLNDLGAAPDQLPLMQHALMRLWIEGEKASPDGPIELKLADYEAMGGIVGALDLDAERAFEAMVERDQRITSTMFRLLSERGPDRRDIRRLSDRYEVSRVSDATVEEVSAVVARFQAPELNFLATSGDILDISHESVIRQWQRLQGWVAAEAESAETYRQLRLAASLYEADRAEGLSGDLLGPRAMEQALAWRDGEARHQGWRPTAAWSERYGPADEFAKALDYLQLCEKSQRERLQGERRRKRLTALLVASTVTLALILGLGWWVTRQQHRISDAKRQADDAKVVQAEVVSELGKIFDAVKMPLPKDVTSAEGKVDSAKIKEAVAYLITTRETALKELNARLATRSLAVGAFNASIDNTPQRGVLLAVEAIRESRAAGPVSAMTAMDALRRTLRVMGGRPLVGHSGRITGIAVAADSQWLATSSLDQTARIWELSGAGRSIVLEHDSPVTGLILSHNDRWLVTFAQDRPARLWDLAGGPSFDGPPPSRVIMLAEEGDGANRATSRNSGFTLDGRWLLAAGLNERGTLWDLKPAAPHSYPLQFRREAGTWPCYDWSLSLDDRWLSFVQRDGRIALWGLGEDGPVPKAITNQPLAFRATRDIVFSKNKQRLTVVLEGGKTLTLNPTEATPAMRASSLAPADLVVLATDWEGRWVVTSRPGSSKADDAVLWDVAANGDAVPYHLGGFPSSLGTKIIEVFEGNRLVARAGDGTVLTWDLTEKNLDHRPVYLTGHVGPVRFVAFDGSRRLLFSAGSDHTVRIWDFTLEDPAARPVVLRGHDNAISAIALSRAKGARSLITGGEAGSVRIWDLEDFPSGLTNEPKVVRGLVGNDTVVLGPKRQWLAALVEGDDPKLFDLRHQISPTSEPIRLRELNGRCRSFVFSQDGRWLVTNLQAEGKATPAVGRTALAWDLEAKDFAAHPLPLPGLSGDVTSLFAFADSRWLCLTTVGGGYAPDSWAAYLVDPRAREPRPIQIGDHTMTLSIDDIGRWLVACGEEGARLIDLKNGPPTAGSGVSLGKVGLVARIPIISADGRWLVISPSWGNIRCWRLDPDRGPIAGPFELPVGGAWIKDIQFDPSHRRLIVTDPSNMVQIWRLDSLRPDGPPQLDLAPASTQGAVISPDARWLVRAAKGQDGWPVVSLLDLSAVDLAKAGRALSIPPLPAADDGPAGEERVGTILALAFSGDGKQLAALGESSASLWDLSSLDRAPVAFGGHRGSIVRLDVDHGRFLVITDVENNVRIWDLNYPKDLSEPYVLRHQEITPVETIVGPQGSWALTVVSGYDSVARFWSLEVDKMVETAGLTVGRNLTRAEWRQNLPWITTGYRKTFAHLPEPRDSPLAKPRSDAP